MTKLIAELEKFKDQLPNYGELLSKAIFRKDREDILKSLIKYLKKNPDVKILDLDENFHPTKGSFGLIVEFECSACNQKVKQFASLAFSESPQRTGTDKELVCDDCIERYRDVDAYDAREEQEWLEQQQREEQESQAILLEESKKADDKKKL